MAFDLIVLDMMMPGENGLELTRALRGEGGVPILLLTAMGETEDRIAGLESGADDYLAKPFEPRELVLRIQTILRRAPVAPAARAATDVGLGEFRFDLQRETLYRGERPSPADDRRDAPAEGAGARIPASRSAATSSRSRPARA